MHACPIENIDGSGEWCGHRRHEDREAPIFEFFNDEPWDESLLDLDQRGLPGTLVVLSRHSLGHTANECVARNLLKKRLLDSLAYRSSRARTNSRTDEETDKQHEQQ